MLPLRSLLSTAVTTALLGIAASTAVTVTAAPAQAGAPTTQTTVDFAKPRLVDVYGSYLDLSGGSVHVTNPDGSTDTADQGVSVLQRQVPGSAAWQDVESDDSPGFLYFPSVSTFSRNESYRVHFLGGTSFDGTVTYPEAYSAVTQVATLLDASVTGKTIRGRLFAAFSVVPRAKYPVKVQIKTNGRWRPYAKLTTDSRGHAKVRITKVSAKGQPYRAIFAGGSRFTSTVVSFKGIRY